MHKNDHEYPISKLYEGFKILQRYGKKNFYEFAEENEMPVADQKRVIYKYDYIKGHEGERT